MEDDHNYSMYVPMVYPTYGVDEHSLTPYKVIDVGPLVENNIDNDFKDKEVYDDDIDDNYRPKLDLFPILQKILLPDGYESSEKESEGELQPSDTDKKYLVLSNCLDQLIKHCPKCGVAVTSKKRGVCSLLK